MLGRKLFSVLVVLFSCALFYSAHQTAFAAPSVDIKVYTPIGWTNGPHSVYAGFGAKLQWGSSDVTSCTASGSGWSGSRPIQSSSYNIDPQYDATYTITCSGPNGTASDSVDVGVNEAAIDMKGKGYTGGFTDGPIQLTESPQEITLQWSSYVGATSCTASGDWSGTKGPSSSGQKVTARPGQTFTITCSGPGGTASDSVKMNGSGSGGSVPTLDLRANNTQSVATIPYGTSTTLSWTTTGATSCEAAGDWLGSKQINGSQSTGNLTTNKTYYLTCTGPTGEKIADSVEVRLSQQTGLPTVDVKVSDVGGGSPSDGPKSVTNNFPFRISWTSTNTHSYSSACTSSEGWTGLQGSRQIANITQSKTYTITCTGPKGTASDSVTVNLATLDFKVNGSDGPVSIPKSGEIITVTWTSTNTDRCSFNARGPSEPHGTTYPTSGSKTFAWNYSGGAIGMDCAMTNGFFQGSVTDYVNINIDSSTTPSVDLKVNGSNGPVSTGWRTKVNLSWTSTNIRSSNPCTTTVSPSLEETTWPANRAATGSYQSNFLPASAVTPRGPTTVTFTITCVGTNGTSVSDSVVVNVAGSSVPTPTPTPCPWWNIFCSNPTPTPTPTPTSNPDFPIDPGPLVPCGKNTTVSFYYTSAAAVRGGTVPFRILVNSNYRRGGTNNPSINSARQVLVDGDLQYVNDASLQYVQGAGNYIDGTISMGSADQVVVKFDLWCEGAQGYDYSEVVKSFEWTVPLLSPNGSPLPTPCIPPTKPPGTGGGKNTPNPCQPSPPPCLGYTSNKESNPCDPTPTINVCPWWNPLCTPTPCPPGVVCITPEPTPIVDWWDNPPGPTDIGGQLVSSICSTLGCKDGELLSAINATNPVIATAALAANFATSIPGMIANVLPQVSNLFQSFGAFFSVHKRKTRWGIVVDSDLGRPIARAIVQVFDATFHQLKETQITGKDGQFGFLLPAGSYYLVVSESGFSFPARRKPPTVLHAQERIYLGEEFIADDRDATKVPHLVVPLDREEKVPFAQMLFWRFAEYALALLDRVSFGFLIAGASLNTFFLLMSPGKLNIIFQVLYLLLFILKLYVLMISKKGIGSIVDATTGKAVDLAVVRLYDAKTNRMVQTRVTNKQGKFFLLVPKGEYTVAVSREGYKTHTIEKLSISGNSSKALSLDVKLVAEVSG